MNKHKRFMRSALKSWCRRTWCVLSVGSAWLRGSRTSRFGWNSPGSFDAGKTVASFRLRRWTRSASGFTALPAMSRIGRILGASFGENCPIADLNARIIRRYPLLPSRTVYPISRGQLVNVVAIAPAGNWRSGSPAASSSSAGARTAWASAGRPVAWCVARSSKLRVPWRSKIQKRSDDN